MVRAITLWAATPILAWSTMSLADERTCYYPDHSIAHNDVPCGEGENVACCQSGAICLSTGLCMNINRQPYSLSRLSCTDENWGPDCPNFCLERANYNDSWISIVLMTYLDGVAKYCCNNIISSGGQPACLHNLEPFTMPDAEIIPNTNLLAGYVHNSSCSSPDDPNSTGDCAASTNSTDSPSNSTVIHSESNHNAAIGAGVGVPLGLIALASIVWALFERRKLHRITAAHAAAVATATSQVPLKQEGWNSTSHAQSTPPSNDQYAASVNPQYSGYPSTNNDPVSGYQQPIVRNAPSGYSEMASSGPVELDSPHRR